MRIALLCPPAEGHYSVFFPLYDLLTGAGHTVTFLTLPEGRGRYQDSGLPYIQYGEELLPDGVLSALLKRRGKSKGLKAMRLMKKELLLMEQALLNSGSQILNELKPDLLIADQVFLSATSIAQKACCRCCLLSTTLPLHSDLDVPPVISARPLKQDNFSLWLNRLESRLYSSFFHPFVKEVNKARKSWGLPTLKGHNSLYRLADRTLIHCPEMLEYQQSLSNSEFDYIQPISGWKHRKPATDTWLKVIDSGKKSIYVSFGTMQNHNISLYTSILNHLNGYEFNVLVSTGGNEDFAHELAKRYPQHRIYTYLPQLDVLKHSDLFITHAGMNSTIEAIQSHTPMLAIPIMGDQNGIAARIQASNIGKVISRNKLTRKGLSSTVTLLLSNDLYKERITMLHESIELHQASAIEVIDKLSITGEKLVT
ncbi:glycosyltransferase [uncultured Vibrio sp.]|uniref:glycosyltransferase n=1 Tax=uncultured Vibrio sp. TaxID=114054 RepID=UPI0026200D31|nr:glycosyltransferase [uncultured Vibrio sp.]